MTVYNYVLAIIISCAIIDCNNTDYKLRFEEKNNKIKIKSVALLFMMVILGTISAIRDISVGTDLTRYIPRYIIISQTSWKNLIFLPSSWSFETGFIYFCKLISFISPDDPKIFIILTSIIVSVGYYFFIKDFSLLPLVSVLIYVSYGYWTNSFNTVRQYVAISILAIALLCWKKNKIALTIVLTIISILLHSTAFVFIIVYFLKDVEFSKRALKLIIVFAALVYFFPISWINNILSRTSFAWYITSSGSGESTLLILLAFLFLSYYLKDQLIQIDEHTNTWIWMLGFAIFSNVLALKIGLFERVMRYYLICLLVLIPDIVFCFRKKTYYFFVYGSIILAFILYFYFIIMASPESSGNTIPYKSYLMN